MYIKNLDKHFCTELQNQRNSGPYAHSPITSHINSTQSLCYLSSAMALVSPGDPMLGTIRTYVASLCLCVRLSVLCCLVSQFQGIQHDIYYRLNLEVGSRKNKDLLEQMQNIICIVSRFLQLSATAANIQTSSFGLITAMPARVPMLYLGEWPFMFWYYYMNVNQYYIQ